MTELAEQNARDLATKLNHIILGEAELRLPDDRNAELEIDTEKLVALHAETSPNALSEASQILQDELGYSLEGAIKTLPSSARVALSRAKKSYERSLADIELNKELHEHDLETLQQALKCYSFYLNGTARVVERIGDDNRFLEIEFLPLKETNEKLGLSLESRSELVQHLRGQRNDCIDWIEQLEAGELALSPPEMRMLEHHLTDARIFLDYVLERRQAFVDQINPETRRSTFGRLLMKMIRAAANAQLRKERPYIEKSIQDLREVRESLGNLNHH